MKTSAPSASVLPVHVTAGSQSLLPPDPIESLVAAGDLSLQIAGIPRIVVGPVAVIGPGFKRAIRIDAQPFFGNSVREGAKAEFRREFALKIPTTSAVLRGDVLLIRFALRCVKSTDGSGSCICQFRPSEYELDKPAEMRAMASTQWSHVSFPFQCDLNLPAGQASVVFTLGFEEQTIEIGGIEAVNYGRNCPLDQLSRSSFTYTGRSAGAAWRHEADQRIEQIRKGDFSLAVLDPQGRALTGARVSGSLVRHDFGFGSCVTVDHLLGTNPDCDAYRKTFLSHFNRAVFENDMKWPDTEGKISPRLDAAVGWLHQHEISVRGHNLVWPAWRWLPASLREIASDGPALRRRAAEHITHLVTHFKGSLTDWDVVNEPDSCHEMFDAMEAVGGRALMCEWFKLARQADSNCRLCINDFGILDGGRSNPHRSEYFRTIGQLLHNGAPLGGIGIQSHFSYDLPSPQEMLAVLDEFALLGLPLQSTEFSINCDDQQLQADFLRDYARTVFSHPAAEELILWGFWSRRHWRPRSALFNDDWSIRPMGHAWADLQQEWSTRFDLATDEQGKVRFRGFFGSYDVELKLDGQTIRRRVNFCKQTANVSIVLEQ